MTDYMCAVRLTLPDGTVLERTYGDPDNTGAPRLSDITSAATISALVLPGQEDEARARLGLTEDP